MRKVQIAVNGLIIIGLLCIAFMLLQIRKEREAVVNNQHSQIMNDVNEVIKKFDQFEQDQRSMLDSVMESIGNITNEVNKIKSDKAGIKLKNEEAADPVASTESEKSKEPIETQLEIPSDVTVRLNQQFGSLGVDATNYTSEAFIKSLTEVGVIPYSKPEDVPEGIRERLQVYHELFKNTCSVILTEQDLRQIEYCGKLNKQDQYVEFAIDAGKEEIDKNEKMKEMKGFLKGKPGMTIVRMYEKLGVKRYYFASLDDNPELFEDQVKFLEAKNRLYSEIYKVSQAVSER